MSENGGSKKSESAPRPASSANIFVTSFIVSLSVALLLFFSGTLYRAELQNINRLYEGRRWLCWAPESLDRLNWQKIVDYHEEHEIPRSWWAWDYTLSWLLEHNHPAVKHKFVIFNHLIEDEPPKEALESHKWMEPLMHYPLSRKTVAEIVEYAAKNGARAIVLDNDFPQYSPGDRF